jgi:hypothetical protein
LIKFDGYYVSAGKENEEWHAGIHKKWRSFSAYSFNKDGRVLVATTRTNLECKEYFFQMSEFKSSNRNSYFSIEGHNLDIFREDGLFYQRFKIENSYIIDNEYGTKYQYKSFLG